MIPYGRQCIEPDDLEAVLAVLRSPRLTCGQAVDDFESAVAEYVGAGHAVAVSSGTAALHAAMAALGIGPGDEVVVPAITFAATANCVLYQNARPVVVDVDPATLLVDPAAVAAAVTPKTKAVIAVDYAGQPCDYVALEGLCRERGLTLVADACHSLGGADEQGRLVGTLATLTALSFHPVKHVTTGEGGMVVTGDAMLAAHMRRFRSHGIDSDFARRQHSRSHRYEVIEPGYNYRLSDINCALGASQMRKLPRFLEARKHVAARYDAAFEGLSTLAPLVRRPGIEHAFHLYVVRLRGAAVARRDEAFDMLLGAGIGANVHYPPVHLHPYFRKRLGTGPGLCPNAEAAYAAILTLPLHPLLTDNEIEHVIKTVQQIDKVFA
ncbi:MAG: DegT/DnrJ/EryC1/StrS family aminotransferase [Solidesulfovibrio sp.]